MKSRGLARRTVPYLIAATSGFVLSYLAVALFVFPTTLISSDAPVPNVTGLQYTAALAKLKAAGFKGAKGEQRYQSGIPEGAVLSQSPVPGTVESKGTTVILDLSRGQRMVDMPRIVGLTQEQAQRAVEQIGLEIDEVIERQDDAPRGQVLASTPAGGARVAVPSPVTLIVSSGPGMVAVPDVTGQDYDAARALLAQLGLAIGRVRIDSSSALPHNIVIEQTPAANHPAPAGTTISLTISGHP